MPPQQSDRLLDFLDELFDFRAHENSIPVAAGRMRPPNVSGGGLAAAPASRNWPGTRRPRVHFKMRTA